MRYKAAPGGHQYNIEISGPDRGRPLLLLHGFTGDATTWRNLIREMPAGFRLIRLDILGHGKSDKPESASSYHMPAVAADIIDLLDQLSLAQTHLLGYSLGGAASALSRPALSGALYVAPAGKRIARHG